MTNATGFTDPTYAAICAIIGIDKKASNTGFQNTLREIHDQKFKHLTGWTIGEVVDAFAKHLLAM